MKAYRVFVFANLPRSDMVGYFRSYKVFDPDYSDTVAIHEHYGSTSEKPECAEGFYPISEKVVFAGNPYQAITRFCRWENYGLPESYLTAEAL